MESDPAVIEANLRESDLPQLFTLRQVCYSGFVFILQLFPNINVFNHLGCYSFEQAMED